MNTEKKKKKNKKKVPPLPWKPLGVLLPGVVSRLPVPQPAVAVEALHVVAVT